jgi:hypothetical protein
MSVPAGEMGSVGTAEPTATATPATGTLTSSQQLVAQGVAKGGGWFGSGGLSLISGLPNYGLIAVGAILVVGALLISTKTDVIQVASGVAA